MLVYSFVSSSMAFFNVKVDAPGDLLVSFRVPLLCQMYCRVWQYRVAFQYAPLFECTVQCTVVNVLSSVLQH